MTAFLKKYELFYIWIKWSISFVVLPFILSQDLLDLFLIKTIKLYHATSIIKIKTKKADENNYKWIALFLVCIETLMVLGLSKRHMKMPVQNKTLF